MCSCSIKRCSSFRDNSYCDECEERVIDRGEAIKLQNSSKKCFEVEKINVLSGLVRDRKNKFLFVGEGKLSLLMPTVDLYYLKVLFLTCNTALSIKVTLAQWY